MIESDYLKDNINYFEKLGTIPSLADFSEKDLKGLLELSKIRKYEPGEMSIYNFDIRLKRSLKQGICPLQRSNFIRNLGFSLYRGRIPGDAVKTPLKGVILGVI